VQPLVFDFADVAEADPQLVSQLPLRQVLSLPKVSDSFAKLHFQLVASLLLIAECFRSSYADNTF